MAVESPESLTTRLLTMLNVAALKNTKRSRWGEEHEPTQRLNKRRSLHIAGSGESTDAELKDGQPPPETASTLRDETGFDATTNIAEDMEVDTSSKDEDESPGNSYLSFHFGAESKLLSDDTRKCVEERDWDIEHDAGKLGTVAHYSIKNVKRYDQAQIFSSVPEKLLEQYRKSQVSLPSDLRLLQDSILSEIESYEDFYLPRINHDKHMHARQSISLHALSHVTRKRRIVLKNNERLSRASKSMDESSSPDIKDQGFTRPSVLILLPFRNCVLRWMDSLLDHTKALGYQVENHSRFMSEYALPSDAEDKLESAPPGTHPSDHVEMFKGNVDDSFRLGVKITRKSIKLFSDFYQSDIIIASPLGLRMSLDKEKSSDFLSSIEVLVVDQMDALSMQNWEHLQFVLSNTNLLPKDTRDTDFSRVKPWYLEGHSIYLRQTIMLSPYDHPDFRHIFNSLKNVAGKKRVEGFYSPISVPEGISQSFIKFDCNSFKDEADKRFEHFTATMLPSVLKSAVQSTNALIFVPSSFDFIRIENHLRKNDVSFASLSEYSSNQDISRARQSFFLGKKSFLLVSERFHFFRRYKLRGVRNLIFYGLPDHSQFYAELLSFPFLDEGVEASDVHCRALFCKYDWMKLERIAGTEGALDMMKQV